MARTTHLLTAAATALLVLAAAPASAEDDGSRFDGQFLVGFRTVDVGGSDTKFAEDINLDDGPRLFNLRLDLVPDAESRKLVDRVSVDVDNFGGDPFESLRLSAQKFGSYDFEYIRTKSIFFYEDTILPAELGNPSLSNAGDFHTFDFERTRDRASFDVDLTRAAKLHFTFDRFDKRGESTTTLDVQRDEFELDRPINESMDDYTLGFEYSWGKTTLVLEETFRDYENLVEIFLPGLSVGENPTDATVLDFFFLDQPYDFESFQHTVRVVSRPRERLTIRAAASLQTLDLDVSAEEESQGTGFRGNPFTTDVIGSGDIDRDVDLYDLEVTYGVSERVAFVGRLRQQELDQDGSFDFGTDDNRGRWDVETSGLEAGVQVAVNPEVTVAGGVIYESRDVEFGHTEEDEFEVNEEETDQDGFFLRLGWRPTGRARIDFELEDSSFDDPFTLASATDRQRYRVAGRFDWESGVYLNASYQKQDYENDESGWEADTDRASFRIGYRKAGFDGSFGTSISETERSIDQLVTTLPGFGGGVTFPFPIFFESDADFFDARFRWKIDDRWLWAFEGRIYENEGSFLVERDDFRTFVEVALGSSYLLHLGYRTIDYEEDVFDFDDYDADIAELSVGYRW